jgi:hypothetical protein
MVRGMLQECCHLPRHRQPLIVYYTDSGLSSCLNVLEHIVKLSLGQLFSPHASIINAHSSGQNLELDLRFPIGLTVQIPNPNYFIL